MSTTTNLQKAATIVSLTGEAFARGTDGAVRRLAAGDVILENEIIFTLTNGRVELALADGHIAAIQASESCLIGPETMVATSPTSTRPPSPLQPKSARWCRPWQKALTSWKNRKRQRLALRL